MSNLVRSVFVRVCGAFGLHGSRRSVRVPLSISLSERVYPGRSNQACAGHTRDLSLTGLSFVLPTTRIDNRHIFNEGRAALRVRLELPGGPVEMSALPVRYDSVGGRGKERGYLVGAHILNIREGDRARYHNFIRRTPAHGAAPQIKKPNSASVVSHTG